MPANIALAGTEVSLVTAMSRETILKQYLNTVKKDYDFILLDCMPSLGMLTVNALAAADQAMNGLHGRFTPVRVRRAGRPPTILGYFNRFTK